ncbi:uncharacterized protein C10orf95-like [Mustela lutreola]|uniref:uncharacterized protein C10orf95-like n=1 Tax=Mustela lutreola TaxID=9666 RepID=UPI002797005F|nr:uncharacterized protein C10orf95-like [Mustela lutreola]
MPREGARGQRAQRRHSGGGGGGSGGVWARPQPLTPARAPCVPPGPATCGARAPRALPRALGPRRPRRRGGGHCAAGCAGARPGACGWEALWGTGPRAAAGAMAEVGGSARRRAPELLKAARARYESLHIWDDVFGESGRTAAGTPSTARPSHRAPPRPPPQPRNRSAPAPRRLPAPRKRRSPTMTRPARVGVPRCGTARPRASRTLADHLLRAEKSERTS